MAGGPKAKPMASGISLPIFWLRVRISALRGEFRGHALVPGIELKEVESGVRSRSVGQQAESGDAVERMNAVRVRQDVIDFVHDGVGALQRGGIRQLHLHERVALIFFRNEAGGQALAHAHGRRQGFPRAASNAIDPAPDEQVAPGNIAPVIFPNLRLNQSKKLPRGPFDFLRGRSIMAASAGESVSALKAEISTEMAIVTANCWLSSPLMPPMSAMGTKTEARMSAMPITGPETSSIALMVASFGDRPCSM